MSSAWGGSDAEAAGGFGDGRGGLAADLLGAGEAEELAGGRVGGFDDAVGDEGEAGVRREVMRGFFVLDVRGEDREEGRAGFRSPARPSRGRGCRALAMRGAPVGVDEHGAAGGEAADVTDEQAIKLRKDLGRLTGELGAQAANDGGDDHGSLQAFAADVADDGEQALIVCAVRGGKDEEEVSADLARGEVDAFDFEARGGGLGGGDEELLDGAGGFEFRGGNLFVSTHANETIEDDGD